MNCPFGALAMHAKNRWPTAHASTGILTGQSRHRYYDMAASRIDFRHPTPDPRIELAELRWESRDPAALGLSAARAEPLRSWCATTLMLATGRKS